MDRKILDAVRKLEISGKKACYSQNQMKALLDTGMTPQEILDLIASLLTSMKRPPESSRDPLSFKRWSLFVLRPLSISRALIEEFIL